MKLAGLASIAATLAVVFTSSAVGLDNGQVIEICQEGPTEELWQRVRVFGNDPTGAQQSQVFPLSGGCNVLGGFLWVGSAQLSFRQQLGDPDFDSPITDVQTYEIPRQHNGATFRCDPVSKPSEN